ncbi:MAG: hypothetical protein GEV09_18195 [Pseudonocardiaceae bacterium]|nr:hypothetical protein [Pseudonocardiaceae bacterium]
MPVAVTGAVAALLTGAAAVTADQAGCDHPGTWVVDAGGAQLVGGCLDSEDLPVAPAPPDRARPPAPVPLGD